jgi:hypothetical protein
VREQLRRVLGEIDKTIRDSTQTGQSARKLKRQIGAVLSLLGVVE